MTHARLQPCWRRSDRAPADAAGLYDPDRPWRFDGLRPAAFRTGAHGLVEWTVDGEDYVKQALPPWTVDFAFPGDSLVAEMDYAGIERALLHRTPYMGLNDGWIADCCRRHPGRIQGLVQIPEWWFPDRTEEAVGKLERAIRDHRLSGLQFAPFHRTLYDLSPEWTGPDFDPLWAAVAELGIPVFFTLGAAGSPAGYIEEMRALRVWMDRFPDVDVVLTHGFPWRLFAEEDRLHVPDEVYEAVPTGHPRFHIQILFAVFLQVALGLPHAADAARPGEDGGTHRRRPHPVGDGHPHRPPSLDLPSEPGLREAVLPVPRRGRNGGDPRRQHGAAPGDRA